MIINGTSGNDSKVGTLGDDTISLFGGNDQAFARAGNDRLYGNAGNDSMHGGDGNDNLYGDAGRDLLYGGNGYDALEGGSGNDQLWGGNGVDVLEGGSGHDVLQGEAGDDFIEAGDDAHGVVETETTHSADSVWTSRTTRYSGDADTVYGGAGNDLILVGGHGSQLFGGSGSDLFHLAYGEAGKFSSVFDGQTTTGYEDWQIYTIDDAVIRDFSRNDQVEISAQGSEYYEYHDLTDPSNDDAGSVDGSASWDFDDIDTNHNGITDPGDHSVTEVRGDTVISLHTLLGDSWFSGNPVPDATLTLHGITGLTAVNFIDEYAP